METPCNYRWERTKRHILRNFLNPVQLSPISEEERSSPDSGSSLPELVIEREPNRHDDSDAFYAGLERRMRRYYRHLFLGETVSEDDDSDDFEVNRSMASTFIIEDQNEKYEAENAAAEKTHSDSDENISIKDNRQRDFTSRDNEKITYDVSEPIDAETNTEYVTIDDGKHSFERDDFNVNTTSGNFKIIANESIPDVNDERDEYDFNGHDYRPKANSTFEADLNVKARSTEDAVKTKSKSDTEDLLQCQRISTTVVEIHEPRQTRMLTRVFEDGSPVLMPKCIRFHRTVFGRRIRFANQSGLEELNESGEEKERDLSQSTNKFDSQGANTEENIENDDTSEVHNDKEVESVARIDNNEKGTENINEEFQCEEKAENYETEADIGQENIEEETDDVEEETESIEEETESNEKETESNEEETESIEEETESIEEETESIEEETTVQKLLTASEITNVSEDSATSRHSDGLSKDGNPEDDKNVNDIDDKSSGHQDLSQIYNQPAEESIGPDEFDYTVLGNGVTEKSDTQNLANDWEASADFFEHAMRKGVFDAKNARKGFGHSSDDMESSDELEPVEEMRGLGEAGVDASLVRESAGTGDATPAFEARTSAEKLEEISSDLEEINAQEIEIENESTEHTPRTKTAVVSAWDDIWSVSPIQVDIEHSPSKRSGSNKRKTDSKVAESKKKRKNMATQASSNEVFDLKWEDLKADIFVGTPLVLRLCGCENHVCKSQTAS